MELSLVLYLLETLEKCNLFCSPGKELLSPTMVCRSSIRNELRTSCPKRTSSKRTACGELSRDQLRVLGASSAKISENRSHWKFFASTTTKPPVNSSSLDLFQAFRLGWIGSLDFPSSSFILSHCSTHNQDVVEGSLG